MTHDPEHLGKTWCIEGRLHAGFGFLWEIRETKNGGFSSHGRLRLADQLRKISEASAVGVLVENPMETPSSWYRIHSQLVFNGYFFRGTALKTFTYQFVVSSDDDVPTDQLPKFMLTSMLLDGRRNMHGFVRILGTPLDMLARF